MLIYENDILKQFHSVECNPANTTHQPNVGLTLAHRQQRRPNIGPALRRCVVFVG